jgi:xanthosine utilization system XapX-like protein
MKIFLLSLSGGILLTAVYCLNFSLNSLQDGFNIAVLDILWGLIVGMYGDLKRKE